MGCFGKLHPWIHQCYDWSMTDSFNMDYFFLQTWFQSPAKWSLFKIMFSSSVWSSNHIVLREFFVGTMRQNNPVCMVHFLRLSEGYPCSRGYELYLFSTGTAGWKNPILEVDIPILYKKLVFQKIGSLCAPILLGGPAYLTHSGFTESVQGDIAQALANNG